MLIVRTDQELDKALRAREKKFIFEGPKASEIIRKIEEAERKKKRTRTAGIGIGVLCLLAAPLTLGGSLFGLSATVGAVALTEAIIITIITGVVTISVEAIKAYKEYRIEKLGYDRIEFTRK